MLVSPLTKQLSLLPNMPNSNHRSVLLRVILLLVYARSDTLAHSYVPDHDSLSVGIEHILPLRISVQHKGCASLSEGHTGIHILCGSMSNR